MNRLTRYMKETLCWNCRHANRIKISAGKNHCSAEFAAHNCGCRNYNARKNGKKEDK